jgi:hypothetical protein
MVTMKVAEANRRWIEEEDGIVDDCTIIVCLLDVIKPTAKESAQLPKPSASEHGPTISVAQAMHSIAKKNVTNSSYQSSRQSSLETAMVKVCE